MRKSKKLCQTIIDGLCEHGNVRVICQKVGISTRTYYHWKDKDEEFRKGTEEAVEIGKSTIGDLAEAQNIKLIKEGNVKAVINQLKRNDRREEKRQDRKNNALTAPVIYYPAKDEDD